MNDQFEGLAQARGARAAIGDVVVLAVVLEGCLPANDRAHDVDVLARLDERLAVGLAVPPLHDLRPRQPEPEEGPATGEEVEGDGRHRRHGGCPGRHLHDRRAQPDLRRLGTDPRDLGH